MYLSNYYDPQINSVAEKTSNFCLNPLVTAFGRKVTVYRDSQDENQVALGFKVEKTHHFSIRILSALGAILLFPITLLGLIIRAASKTHRQLVKNEMDFLKNLRNEKITALTAQESVVFQDTSKDVNELNQTEGAVIAPNPAPKDNELKKPVTGEDSPRNVKGIVKELGTFALNQADKFYNSPKVSAKNKTLAGNALIIGGTYSNACLRVAGKKFAEGEYWEAAKNVSSAAALSTWAVVSTGLAWSGGLKSAS